MPAKSTYQYQQENIQIELEDRIADEKTRQTEYKLDTEIESTEIARLKYEQRAVDRQIEEYNLEGKEYELDKAYSEMQIKREEAGQADTRLGMAIDTSIGLEVQRRLKQEEIMSELDAMSIKLELKKADNENMSEQFRVLHNRIPQLEPVNFSD